MNSGTEPVTVFLDLFELSSLASDGIMDILLKCLHDHGLMNDILHECWLGLATDGASVILSRKAAVYVKLKTKFSNIIFFGIAFTTC